MPQFGSWKNYVTLTMVDVSIHGSVESDGHADFFLHFQIYTQVRYTNMENRTESSLLIPLPLQH